MSAEEIKAISSEWLVSQHDTEAEAILAAKIERDRDCAFEDWSEEYYKDADPPYHSSCGENWDEDEWKCYFIISPAKQATEIAKKAAADARAAKSKPKKRNPHIVAFGLVQGSATAADKGVFFRNPSPLSCAEIMPASTYPGTGTGSMLYQLQKNSERNYLMHSFCLGEGGSSTSGASFTKYKRKHVINACLTWKTPMTLDDMSENTEIVDTVHANLFQVNMSARRTDILLTTEALLSACSPTTTSLFLNCFSSQGYDSGFNCVGFTTTSVARAIDATKGNLQILSMVESEIALHDLAALEKCTDLKGVLLEQLHNATTSSNRLTDVAMASFLRASPHLRWLWIGSTRPAFFGDLCWAALEDGCCPELELLWIDQSGYGEMVGRTFANPDNVRRALRPGSSLARTLKLCMINRTTAAKSRYILGGKGKAADQLDGKKPKPISYRYDY